MDCIINLSRGVDTYMIDEKLFTTFVGLWEWRILDVAVDTVLKALPHGREKSTFSTTRRYGLRIPTAKRGEVHVGIVMHEKHVLFSLQREVRQHHMAELLFIIKV